MTDHDHPTTITAEFLRQWLADPEGAYERAPTGHGTVPPAMMTELVREAVDRIVLPGFDHVGVDSRAGREWFAVFCRA